MAISLHLDKEVVAHPYNGTLLSSKQLPRQEHDNLRSIMLHERSQTLKAMYCMLLFM